MFNKFPINFQFFNFQTKKFWFSVSSCLVLALLIFYFTFSAPFGFPREKTFEVERGTTLAQIADRLDEEGLIRSKIAFLLLVKLFKDERSVKAGLYYFEKPLGLIELANRLARGKHGIGLIEVTIREGLTNRDIALVFEEKKMFTANEMTPYADLEGYLFPDTYFFPQNIGPENVIRAMLENFDRKLTPDLHKDIATQSKTIFEVITMASIIEREASESEDRKIISGILWKRVKAGMAMQADATITYLVGNRPLGLTAEDLAIDSSYNTYKYPGLPLGPISNPGLNAIQSAIYPEVSPYWYYLHDQEGNAHYAKTFKEHKENRLRYLR